MEKLNDLANIPYLPTQKMDNLEKEKKYKVTGIKQINTKYGVRIVVTLNREFQTFIPKRVSEVIVKDNQLFEDLTAKMKEAALFIVYHGNNQFEFVN